MENMDADALDADAYVGGMDDMDDLFNETQPGDAIPHHNGHPAQKALLHRLDDLHSTGCCQKIAWSRFGAIASIAPDARSVHAHAFAQKSGGEEHALTTVKPVSLNFPSKNDITHLCWTPTGVDLAIVDCVGGISMHTVMISVNSFRQSSYFESISGDATGAVVGFEWLDQHKSSSAKSKYCSSAALTGHSWRYAYTELKPRGPVNPFPGKNAAVVVSRSSHLRLLFGRRDPGAGFEFSPSIELQRNASVEALLTHAAIVPDQDRILVATWDLTQTMRLYLVAINWRVPNFQRGPQGPMIPSDYKLDPIPVAKLLRVFRPSLGPQMLSMQMSHLDILPSSSDPATGQSVPATVLAAFTLIDDDFTLPKSARSRKSRLLRWEIADSKDQLHSSFDALAGQKLKAEQHQLETHKNLEALPEIDIQGLVMAMFKNQTTNLVAFCKNLGGIEFRDRFGLQLVSPGSGAKVTSLPQAGFYFDDQGPVIHCSLSTNQCLAIARGPDDAGLRLLRMVNDKEHATRLALNSPAMAALALTFASACFQYINNDDVLAILIRDLPPEHTHRYLEEVYTALEISVDCLPDSNVNDDKAIKHIGSIILPRALSYQQALGTRFGSQDISAKIACTTLALRTTIMSFRFSLQTVVSDADGGIDTPASVVGVVEWFFQLISLILDELLQLSRDYKVSEQESGRAWIQGQIDSKISPAMPVMLCSISRLFLRYSCRYMRSMIDQARRQLQSQRARHVNSWLNIVRTSDKFSVNLGRFESLLSEIDHHMKTAYEAAKLDREATGKTERGLLISGQIPDVLMPVVQRLLTTSMKKYVDDEGCDPMKVYFADLRLLGLTEDEDTKAYHRLNRIDVLRKMPLVDCDQWRRCSRCSSVTEDVTKDMGTPRQSQWIISLQKSCVCGNAYLLTGVHDEASGAAEMSKPPPIQV